jgi:DNA-binding winged helix-turn-helix (wHTH) protein
VALCDRCGEEIALANALDQAGDIDRRRHRVMVAGKPRSLTATHWRIFMLLYRHRGDVVANDRIHAELSESRDRPSAQLIREHMRQLRKVLAGSRYQIVNYRSLGYELYITRCLGRADNGDPAREVTALRRRDWCSERQQAEPPKGAPGFVSRDRRTLPLRVPSEAECVQ